MDAISTSLVRAGRAHSASVVESCLSFAYLGAHAPSSSSSAAAAASPVARRARALPGFVRERRVPGPVSDAFAALRALGERGVPHAGRAPVLFLPVDPTHVQQAVPVARALAARGVPVVFATARRSIGGVLRREGLFVIEPQHRWPLRRFEAARIGRRVTAGAAWSAASEGEAGRAITRAFAVASVAMDQALCLLREVAPSVVVPGNDLTVEGRALALAAREAQVPVACLMHGTAVDALHGAHVADRILAYGAAQRRQLTALGVDAARVAVCGAPYLDGRARPSGLSPASGAALPEAARGRPLVLVAVSNPANRISWTQHERTMRALHEASARLPQLSIVVKLHRADAEEHWRASRTKDSRLFVLGRAASDAASIDAWLGGARALVTGASMSAIEAMLAGVPVVTMDFCDELSDTDFIVAGATSHVTQPDALAAAIEAAAHGSDGDQKRGDAAARVSAFLDDYFTARDGHAAARCADVIEELRHGRA